MRLLDVHQLKLNEFPNDETRPPYAIFSHTWGEGEVSLQDLPTPAAESMPGYAKIKKCCEVAVQDGFKYVWIDTCCIDKTSSAELSEAINSMYNWYQSAVVCYTYLSDMQNRNEMARSTEPLVLESRWFTRGWTLQELLAPRIVMFYDRNWIYIGTKRSLQGDISYTTGIPREALLNERNLETFSIAQRMSWAAKRETTRVEDIAYCLMGIFDVNMPTLYGEGRKAFIRLQLEIMKGSDDHSLFAWSFKRSREFGPGSQNLDIRNNKEGRRVIRDSLSSTHGTGTVGSKSGLLSGSPRHFESAQGVQRTKDQKSSLHPFAMTNNGLHIWLPMVRVPLRKHEVYQVIFNCDLRDGQGPLTVFLERNKSGQYSRIFPRLVCTAGNLGYDPEPVELFVKEDYLEESQREKVNNRFEHQLHLVENSSPNTGYILMSASGPQILQDKVVNLHLASVGSRYSLTDIAYITVGAKHGHLAHCLIALGVRMLEKHKIFYNISSGEKDVEEAVARISKYEQNRFSDTLFKSVFLGLNPVYLGERIIQELPRGQSISIHFRQGPESSDGGKILCHIVMEFLIPA